MRDPVTEAVKRINAEGPSPFYSDHRVPDWYFRHNDVEVLGIDRDGHVLSAEMVEGELVIRDGRPWSAEADSMEPTSLPKIILRFGQRMAIRVGVMLHGYYSTPPEDRL